MKRVQKLLAGRGKGNDAGPEPAVTNAEFERNQSVDGLRYHDLGNLCLRQGDYLAAIENYQKAIAIYERQCPGSTALADSCHGVGFVYNEQGNYSAAKENLQKAITIRERQCPGSTDLASSYNNIGVAYENQGDYSAAIENHQKAITIRERQRPGSTDLASSYYNIGVAYNEQGDYSAAMENYHKAIVIRERQCPGSTDLARSYYNMARVYGKQGNYSVAIVYYEKAITIYEYQCPGSTALADGYHGVGFAYNEQGDYSAATENLQKAITILERQCPGSTYLASSYNNIGVAYEKQGDYSAAIENHQKAITIRERQRPGSAGLANSYNNIGVAYGEQGDYSAAIEKYQKAITTYEHQCPGSTNSARSYYNIGCAYGKQGDYSAAIENHQKAITIYECQSPGSTSLADSYHNIGVAYEKEGVYSAAIENFRKAITIRERHCPGSTDLALSYNDIGVVYRKEGDFFAAMENLQKAIAIRERQCPGTTDMACSYYHIGPVYAFQGDTSTAVENLRKALALYEQLHPGSIDLANCFDSIGNILSRFQGDYSAAVDMFEKSVAIREKISPSSTRSSELVNSYLAVGILYFAQGDNLKAVPCFDKALGIASFGSEEYMRVVRAKVSLLIVIGDISTTQHLLIEAYAFSRSDKHKHTKVNGHVLVAQSEALAEVGDWEEARRKAAVALAIFHGDDPDSKLERAAIGSFYGIALLENGQIDESRIQFDQAKKIFEELHCQSYHEYFNLLNRFGELELRLNNLSQAESLFQKSHQYFSKQSPDSRFFVESLSGQAQLSFFRKDWDDATLLLQQAIQICKKNRIQPHSYKIAFEQVCKEISKLEQQSLSGKKPNGLLHAEAECNPQEQNVETQKESNQRIVEINKAWVMQEQEALIVEGRIQVKKALESDDGSVNHCASLPVEYLEYACKSWTSKIGSGGFGAVFKGHDTIANVTFAIKAILPDRLDDEEKTKFREEIQLLSSLHHPNIIRVLGFCETPQRLCMVLEFAAGGSVYKILSANHLKTRLSPSSRLYIVEALVTALEYLHSKDIFHRDVKPENICLWQGWENNPKMVLIDFGIASRIAATGAVRTMTSNPGTTPYMAKEYLHFPFKFTEKSEVFSVGAVIFCLLTGDCSFNTCNHRKCTIDTLMKHIDISAGTWVHGCDQELATIAVAALQSNEVKRPSIHKLRKQMKELRGRMCSDEYLPADTKARITSFTTRSRPSRLPVPTGSQVCVRCGLIREEGVTCHKKHFICSEGTCLEELVREQMGSLKFRCCGSRCSKSFEIIDLYGKVSCLLYGDILMTMDRMNDRINISEDIQKFIAEQLQQHIRPVIKQVVSCVSVSDNRTSLEAIMPNIELLKKMASDNDRANKKLEKEMSRLIVKQERGAAGIREQQVDLLKKMDQLMDAHLDGVAKLASGRLQCPRLFFLMPVRSQRGRFVQSFGLASEYQLYFLCAHDHSAVKTSVLIQQPKKWIKKALPIVKFAFLTIRLLVASYGIAIPTVTELVPGVGSPESKMNFIVEQLENFLDYDSLKNVEDWMDEASQDNSVGSLSEYMENRAKEISEEAYAALVTEAFKPENRGWMQEMEISQKGSVFAWVKKENLAQWKRD